jgi:hypothetical protein
MANAEFVLNTLNAEFTLRTENTELHDNNETTAFIDITLNNADPIHNAEYAVNPSEFQDS